MSANSSTSSSEPGFGRYLATCVLLAVVAIAALACFNAFIDPYGVFGAPLIDGVNRVKYGFNHHQRIAKAHAVERQRPAAVILGSSRVVTALDPEHPGFRHGPVYNLGIDASGIYEVYRLAQHAQAVRPQEEMVVGVDFYMFNGDWPAQVDFDESRFAVTVDGKLTQNRLPELLSLLLSGDASYESWWSLRHQRDADTHYSALGLRDERYDLPQILARGGHRVVFQANEKKYASYSYSPQGRGYRLEDSAGRSPFIWLRRLLDDCRARGTRARLVINPVHARQYELIVALGLWPAYQDWKRKVLATTLEEGTAHNSAPYPLWDFGVINDITTERVPLPGDNITTMRWYREASHFRKALGDRMLDRVLAEPPAVDVPADGFGLLLTPANIEAQLSLQGRRLAEWQADHPDDIAEILQIAAPYRH
jgi:hypothetical protein